MKRWPRGLSSLSRLTCTKCDGEQYLPKTDGRLKHHLLRRSSRNPDMALENRSQNQTLDPTMSSCMRRWLTDYLPQSRSPCIWFVISIGYAAKGSCLPAPIRSIEMHLPYSKDASEGETMIFSGGACTCCSICCGLCRRAIAGVAIPIFSVPMLPSILERLLTFACKIGVGGY